MGKRDIWISSCVALRDDLASRGAGGCTWDLIGAYRPLTIGLLEALSADRDEDDAQEGEGHLTGIQRPTELPVVNVVAFVLIVFSIIPVYLAQRISADAGGGGRI